MSRKDFQEELVDVSHLGKVRPWKEKKIKNLFLADIYRSIDEKKSLRLRECATFLYFEIDSSDKLSLQSGNFCKVRLCPMCTWRRSLKLFSQVKGIIDAINIDHGYEYLFLTLTVKNCDGSVLGTEIDRMMIAWKKFLRGIKNKNFIKGWYRGLEITHNLSKDTYHPHFHCILVVEKSYFAFKNYISQKCWTDMWKKALGVNYVPIVNVKKTYGNVSTCVAEIAKYSVKDCDYIRPENWELSKSLVECLDNALSHRRLISFGGIFREYHKRLNLDDAIDGDLVDLQKNEDKKCVIGFVGYEWSVGYQQYRRIEE